MQPSTQTIPPHVQVMQLMLGGMIHGAIGALARLGVPDHLEAGPLSAEELALKIGAEPGPLYRLMRACASVGVLHQGEDGKFSQTPMSAILRSAGPMSLRGWAMFTAHEVHHQGWEHLEYCVRTGKQALEKIYGKKPFEFMHDRPDVSAVFNHAMTDLSRLDSPAVAEAYSFEGIHSLMDVAGGHGLLLATVLERHPHLHGTLYEIPDVIAGAHDGPLKPVMNRAKLVEGSMFESVPVGYDAYMMKHIIHDWNDDLSIKILRHCRAGINAGGKLLVIDHVIQAGNDFDPGKFLDLEMLIFPGGRERTEEQFRTLFTASGWRLNRVIPTPAGISIIEGLPA